MLDLVLGDPMPTLYVENVPEELYEALRARARANRSSIASEVLTVLRAMVPGAKELGRRKALLQKALRLSERRPLSTGEFLPAEDIQRQDRLR
jgi:plasmid stability protein